jgi:hypothetical protein
MVTFYIRFALSDVVVNLL